MGDWLRRLVKDPVRPEEIDPLICDAYRFASDLTLTAKRLDRRLTALNEEARDV